MELLSNGRLKWQPNEIMLSKKLKVRFAVAYTNGAGTNIIAHEVDLLDENRQTVNALKTNVPTPATKRDVEAMFIIDSDSDNNKELLIHSTNSLSSYELQDGEFKDSWVYPFRFFEPASQGLLKPLSMQSVIVEDFNNDGVLDHFISTNDANSNLERGVYIMDGASKEIIKTISAGESQSGLLFSKVSDIDGDGSNELIAFTLSLDENSNLRNSIVIIDIETNAVEWTSPPVNYLPSTSNNDLFIADVDNDDALEIITANGYVFDGITKEQEWFSDEAFGLYVRTGDVLGKGYEQILTSIGAEIKIFDAEEKSVITPLLPRTGTHFDIGDLLGDGSNYLVINSTDQDATFQPDYAILAYKYDSATSLFEEVGKISLDGDPLDTSYLLLGDLIGSSAEEVIWQYDGNIRIASLVNSNFVEIPDVQKNYAFEPNFRTFGSRGYRLFNVEEDNANLMQSFIIGDESYVTRDDYNEDFLVADTFKGDEELQVAYSLNYDSDATPETLTCSGSGLNGSRGSSLVLHSEITGTIWTKNTDLYCKSIAFTDVDNDGFLDVIFGGTSQITVYNMRTNAELQTLTESGMQYARTYIENGEVFYIGRTRFDTFLKRYSFNNQSQLQLVAIGEAGPVGSSDNDDEEFFDIDLNADGIFDIVSLSNSSRDSQLIAFDSNLQVLSQVPFELPGQVQAAALDKFQDGSNSSNLIMAIESINVQGERTTRISSTDILENEPIWTSENALIGNLEGSNLYVTNDSRIVFGTTLATFLSY